MQQRFRYCVSQVHALKREAWKVSRVVQEDEIEFMYLLKVEKIAMVLTPPVQSMKKTMDEQT